jgi:hypothetical protein
MFKKTFRNGAGRIALFTLALLAPCVQNTVFGQALTMDGQSGTEPASPQHDRFGPPMMSFHVVDADRSPGDFLAPGLQMDFYAGTGHVGATWRGHQH